MTGLPLFQLEKTSSFEHSFKILLKTYKSKIQQQEFTQCISSNLKLLTINPYPPKSRFEPLPSKLKLLLNWQFHKLVIKFLKGASGEIRIMYLVNEKEKIIKPIFIYTHQQFAKRPPDKEIRDLLKDNLTDFS